MIELLAVFRTVLELCTHLGRHSGRKLLQPMLTALCITAVYTGIRVSQEGAVLPGLRAAFWDNETSRTERRRSQELAILQGELRQFVAANKLIGQLLQSMLVNAPGASRVQLDVIHNGVTGLTGTGLLRYDLANSVAAPGRTVGNAFSNQPLSDWSDVLPSVLSGQCAFRRVATLESVSIQARLEALGAVATLVCPAGDIQGKIVGAIFIMWDVNDPIPDESAMRTIMAQGQHLGGQIAAILDLRGPAPWSAEPISGD